MNDQDTLAPVGATEEVPFNLAPAGAAEANANPFNVEVGQTWNDTDRRRPRQIRVIEIVPCQGKAKVVNTVTGRRGTILLDRFSPANHMRRVVAEA